MRSLSFKGSVFVMCSCFIGQAWAVQSDPVAERKARNAQLERVSPVMAREQAYTPSSQEAVSENLRQVKAMLTTINATLSDLALLGSRADQAKLLLNADKSTQQILADLLADEAQRVAASPIPVKAAHAAPPDVGSEASFNNAPIQAIAPEPPKAFERVTPVVVRSYDQEISHGDVRPAKVILRVGKRDPEVFYVGDTVQVNDTQFTLVSAVAMRTSNKQHGRPVYEITLRSHSGEIQILEWE